MKDGDRIDGNFDECPLHGGYLKGEYDFGLGDATVCTYEGCRCATVWHPWSDQDGGQYYTSYAKAAGRAKLLVAKGSIPLGAIR